MSWTRLESGAIDPALERGLAARVADAAWFLARQWQAGEFKGDDAANPLLIRVQTHSVRANEFALRDGSTVALDGDVPLETIVEREPVRDGPSGAAVSIELGRLLARALTRAEAPPRVLAALRARFPVTLPADDGLDPVGRRRLDLRARTSFDGARAARVLSRRPDVLDELVDGLGAAATSLRGILEGWSTTAAGLFSEPSSGQAWDPSRMAYRFEVRANSTGREQTRLVADDHRGGRLDWYAFDVATSTTLDEEPDAAVRRVEVLPAPVRYRGMPLPRFWEFEDGEVHWGDLATAPQDLARVAVATYATLHGDDWHMVPIRLPVGTLTRVAQVSVVDDFGLVTPIRAAAVIDGGGRSRAWRFFELTGDNGPSRRSSPYLYLPPTVDAAEAGRPLEDVRMIRDEAANMAWALEQRVESQAGRPVDLSARGQLSPHEDHARPTTGAGWPFRLATDVPGHWVPLVPVRVLGDGDDPDKTYGSVMLQRGRMPREGATAERRGARGRVLVPERRLLLHEEEVVREGIRVVRRFQSARDTAGRLHTWVGRTKGPGRGAGDSGLVFDRLDRTDDPPAAG